MKEVSRAKAGLATKFRLECENFLCSSKCSDNSFNTSKKNGQIYEISLCGKGRNSLAKFCSVLGLSSPVTRPRYAAHTKYWEELTTELRDENHSAAVRRAKKKEGKVDEIVDIPTSFDGSWSSRGWTASKGIVSAISEKNSQVLDVILKTRSCSECTKMEAKKKEGSLSTIQQLDWFINHEANCLVNHNGSPQVSYDFKFYFIFLWFRVWPRKKFLYCATIMGVHR